MEYKRETMLMTPEIAREYLKKTHPNQRRYNPGIAEQFARDIRSGRWNSNVHQLDPLCFDAQGRLMNGQHRCNAVIRAGKPIIVSCLYDVPEEYFEFMDLGYKRDIGQLLAHHSTIAKSVIRFANAVEEGSNIRNALKGRISSNTERNRRFDTRAGGIELMNYYKKHQERIDWITTNARKIYKALNGGRQGVFAEALWLILYTSPECDMRYEIENFVHELCSDVPTCRAIANGKMMAIRKIMDAQRQNMQISVEWWFSWTLAIFELRHTNRIKLTDKDIENAIPLYTRLLEMREEK